MSGVRVLVGTRKGAFILTADGTRRDWQVNGPHFGGWEIYHVNGSPADPDRLYASQSSGWFGQLIQRSNDGGVTWEPVGNEFKYEGKTGDHLWYDGTPRPWEFKRIWHLEPSRDDPDTVYAGAAHSAGGTKHARRGGSPDSGQTRPATSPTGRATTSLTGGAATSLMAGGGQVPPAGRPWPRRTSRSAQTPPGAPR